MVRIQGMEAPKQNDYENQKEKIMFTLLFPSFHILIKHNKCKQLVPQIVDNLRVQPNTIS